tara:strand:- start:479 stop:1009 length:531 start_codon:yes stop_codon:yes gene_type:complete
VETKLISGEFKENLLNVYRGEQFGEAFYATLLAETDDENEVVILAALLQLETEGKARVRPFIVKYGLPAYDNPNSIAGGVETARGLENESWRNKFEAMAAIIREQGLPQYEGLLEKVIPEEEPEAAELAEFVAAHERVILEVCENVVNGTPNPTSPLDDFLHFPIASRTRLSNEEN